MTQLAQQTQPQLIVRDAITDDVDRICLLMESYAVRGILLPRSKANVFDNLLKFSIVELNGEIVGCAALEIFTDELCEIRSLVIVEHMKKSGLGRIVVEQLMEKARDHGLKRIMALTYVPDFFHKLGFRTVKKEIFPEKVWGVCMKCSKFNDCDEIAVVRDLT